jgi:hypothetical protein
VVAVSHETVGESAPPTLRYTQLRRGTLLYASPLATARSGRPSPFMSPKATPKESAEIGADHAGVVASVPPLLR